MVVVEQFNFIPVLQCIDVVCMERGMTSTLAFDLFLTLSGSLFFQELASIIKLSSFNTFSLFECRKNLNGSRSLDATIGMYLQ